MELADLDYDLPRSAIAQRPVEPRDQARLLVDCGPGQPVAHHVVADLPRFVRAGDVIVVNTTRVLPARLHLRKASGGAVEVLLLERTGSGTWEALVRPARRVPPGTRLVAGEDLVVEVGDAASDDGSRLVRLHVGPYRPAPVRVGVAPSDVADTTRSTAGAAVRAAPSAASGDVGLDGDTDSGTAARAPSLDEELAALERHGAVPLPPYIGEPLADPERYQTVYAERPESVAAPTAGLHLTPAVLDGCRAAGARVERVELAVGLGTFKPMTAPKVEDHRMHAERYRVPGATLAACSDARRAGGRVVAVGTTSVRALESAALTGQLEGRTELFIHRPWQWRVVDGLLTNLHLPRSSLLALIDAFVGARWHQLYDEALRAGYRFLSFGDAMLLERRP